MMYIVKNESITGQTHVDRGFHSFGTTVKKVALIIIMDLEK